MFSHDESGLIRAQVKLLFEGFLGSLQITVGITYTIFKIYFSNRITKSIKEKEY